MFTRGDPVLLGAGVDLEDVGPRAEYGLLSVQMEVGGEKSHERCLQGQAVKGRNTNAEQDFAATFDNCSMPTIND